LQGPQRRRLLDLGLVPGTLVEAELSGAGGDPVAYRIRGALIALRKDQSRWIQVDRQVDQRAEA
jgi:Fe2+ transport system protein FeoA